MSPFLLREDIRKLDQFSAQTKLLCKHRIETKAQLSDFMSGLEKEKGTLTTEHKLIECCKRRIIDSIKFEEYNKKTSSITGRLSLIRKELKLANGILERSEVVKEKLAQINTDAQQKVISLKHRLDYFLYVR